MADAIAARHPHFQLPTDACDTHFHFFGTGDKYPWFEGRTYTPPPASPAEYRALMGKMGFTRSIVVHPTVYGHDHRCSLDGMAELGPNCHGVAVIRPEEDEKEIERLHKAGFRGSRVAYPSPTAPAQDKLVEFGARIAPFGWHIQLIMDCKNLPDLAPKLKAAKVPVVVDHMGAFRGRNPLGEPGWKALLDMIRDGNTWVKISGYYNYDETLQAPWLGDMVRQLTAAGPERVVWGTDWPHPGHPHLAANSEQAWVNAIASYVEDPAQRQALFAGNAAKRYGFV